MRKEVQVIAKEAFIKKVNKGYPLIEKDALVDGHKLQEEGVIINLVTPKNQFLAKGYYGKQNKGYGWILTKKKSEQIDAAFFAKKFSKLFHLVMTFMRLKTQLLFAYLIVKVTESAA